MKKLHTEESKKKMSDSHKGKKLTAAHKLNISQALRGRIFSKAHKQNLALAMARRVYFPPLSEEHKRKISLANKGHTVSKLTRRKIALTKIGKPRSPETIKKMSESHKGKPSWNKGRPCSDATKKKLAQYKGPKNARYGTHHTEESKNKIANAQKGEKGYHWLGGLSFEPYDTRFGRRLKHQIRTRDKFICQICYKPQKQKTFPVHHIDYNKKNSIETNLITLCPSCHPKTGMNREYWKHKLMYRPTLYIRKRTT